MFQSYDLLRYNVDATECTVVFILNLTMICSIVENFWAAYKPKDLEPVPDASDYSKDGKFNDMLEARSDVKKRNYFIEDENQQHMQACIEDAIKQVEWSSDVTPAEKQRFINLLRSADIEKWEQSRDNMEVFKNLEYKKTKHGVLSEMDALMDFEVKIMQNAKKCHEAESKKKGNANFKDLNAYCGHLNYMMRNIFLVINQGMLDIEDDENSMGYNSTDEEFEKEDWRNEKHDTVFEHKAERQEKLQPQPTDEETTSQDLKEKIAPATKKRRITPNNEKNHTAAFRQNVVNELLAKIQEYKNDADGKEKFTKYYEEKQYGGLQYATQDYEKWTRADDAKPFLQAHVRGWITVPPFNPVESV